MKIKTTMMGLILALGVRAQAEVYSCSIQEETVKGSQTFDKLIEAKDYDLEAGKAQWKLLADGTTVWITLSAENKGTLILMTGVPQVQKISAAAIGSSPQLTLMDGNRGYVVTCVKKSP